MEHQWPGNTATHCIYRRHLLRREALDTAITDYAASKPQRTTDAESEQYNF
jgi:hypothetical protein